MPSSIWEQSRFDLYREKKLKVHHKNTISLSTLKRYLKKLNSFHRPLMGRRIIFYGAEEIVQESLNGCGSNLSYGKVCVTFGHF